MSTDPPEHDLYAQELNDALNAIQTELIHRQDPAYLADKRLAMAFDLAPDLNTCIALMLGERVPIEQLDPTAVTRYGLRRQDAA